MRCLNCDNEISPGETFCGQCGMPNMPPAQPTEVVNSLAARSGQLGSGYNANIAPIPNAHNSGVLPPSSPSHTYYGGPSTPGGFSYPNQPIIRPSGPLQQTGFYRDATEAISSPANNGLNFQAGYPQGFAGMPVPGRYQGVSEYIPQMQPFQTGNFADSPPVHPQSQLFLRNQGYRRQPEFPPPQKQRNKTILIIVCACLAFIIITAAAFGAVSLLHKNPSKAHNKTTSRPTSAVTATMAPAPSSTAASTPSPTASPAPSVDPNFTQCATECTSNGFIVEYPNGWTVAASQDPNGFGGAQFSNSSSGNPAVLDEIANFKSATTTANPPEDLLAADLNSQFANQQNYVAPTSPLNAWIDGAKWLNESASYQLNNQTEDVEVFAIVYQQRSYIIELQAPDSLFNQINTQFFEMMLGRFQFQQSAP